LGTGKDILAALLMGGGGMAEGYADQKTSSNNQMDQLLQLYMKQMLDQNDPYRQAQMQNMEQSRRESEWRMNRPDKLQMGMDYLQGRQGDRETELQDIFTGAQGTLSEGRQLDTSAQSIQDLLGKIPSGPTAIEGYGVEGMPQFKDPSMWQQGIRTAAETGQAGAQTKLQDLLPERKLAQERVDIMGAAGGPSKMAADEYDAGYGQLLGVGPDASQDLQERKFKYYKEKDELSGGRADKKMYVRALEDAIDRFMKENNDSQPDKEELAQLEAGVKEMLGMNNKQYNSAHEVGLAYQAGDLSPEEAARILEEQFPESL